MSGAEPPSGGAMPAATEEALAVRIAHALRGAHGDAALDRARAHLAAARAVGHIGRSDLLNAVVTVVADRADVFRRSRLPL